jgi:Protein of unknown function (DUF2867)
VTNDGARRAFAVRPRGYREAIARALANEDRELAETRWSDALSAGALPRSWTGVSFGSRFVDSRAIRVAAPPPVAFEPIARLGGKTGCYTAGALWRLRGFLDLLVGGVGLRRGRRDPRHLVGGDALDFWRVEAIEPGRLLRLAAEMRLPGRAWLVFEIEPDGPGSVIRQTALFDPVGSRVSPTGTCSIPSTGSCSAACCAASRVRPDAGRDRDVNPDRGLCRRRGSASRRIARDHGTHGGGSSGIRTRVQPWERGVVGCGYGNLRDGCHRQLPPRLRVGTGLLPILTSSHLIGSDRTLADGARRASAPPLAGLVWGEARHVFPSHRETASTRRSRSLHRCHPSVSPKLRDHAASADILMHDRRDPLSKNPRRQRPASQRVNLRASAHLCRGSHWAIRPSVTKRREERPPPDPFRS